MNGVLSARRGGILDCPVSAFPDGLDVRVGFRVQLC